MTSVLDRKLQQAMACYRDRDARAFYNVRRIHRRGIGLNAGLFTQRGEW